MAQTHRSRYGARVSIRRKQLRGGVHIAVGGTALRAVLTLTALALLSAWLVLPSPAAAQTQFTLTVTLAGGGTGSAGGRADSS